MTTPAFVINTSPLKAAAVKPVPSPITISALPTTKLLGSPVSFALRTLIVLAGMSANLASVMALSSTVLPAIVPENDPAVKTPVLGL